jgi:hypothetical protein
VTVRVAFAIAVMLASLPLLAGCGERERAKDGAGGSRVAGTQTAAEHTADEKTVEEPASGHRAAAQAGDAEARAGDGAVARAGDAVAYGGPGAMARAGDAEARANDGDEGKGTGTDGEDIRRKVTLDVGGERGMKFSGTCSAGGEERRIGGRVPESYSYELGSEKLECEIRRNGSGALEVVLATRDDVRSVQRQTGAGNGTITMTYSGKGASGVSSSASQVSSIVSSTKSR